MPVHWYYDRSQLFSDFKDGITKYEAPKASFPGSIMNLSNTGNTGLLWETQCSHPVGALNLSACYSLYVIGGGGRGGDKGSIVGDVILHGKKKYWMKGGSYHYHHGMAAGENTLDSLVTRVLIQTMNRDSGKFHFDHFQESYIKFMTTPDSHNDIYAGTCHRMFFSNFAKGIAPKGIMTRVFFLSFLFL